MNGVDHPRGSNRAIQSISGRQLGGDRSFDLRGDGRRHLGGLCGVNVVSDNDHDDMC